MDFLSPLMAAITSAVGSAALAILVVVRLTAGHRREMAAARAAIADLKLIAQAVEEGILTIAPGGRTEGLNATARDIVGQASLDPSRPFLDRTGLKVYAIRDIGETLIAEGLEKLLGELREGMLAGEKLDSLLSLSCLRLKEILGFPMVWITTVETDGSLPIRACCGVDAVEMSALLGGGFPLTMVASRIRRSQLAGAGEGQGPGIDNLRRRGMGCVLAMPLIAGRTVLGIMHVASSDPTIEGSILKRLDGFAARLAMVINMAMVQDLMRLQSAAMNASASAVMIAEAEGRIVWVNPAFCRLTGYSAAEISAMRAEDFEPIENSSAERTARTEALISGKPWRGEMIGRRKDGTLYSAEQTIAAIRNRERRISHTVTVREDISAHKAAEERIRYLSNFDTLTGLANRRLFIEQLDEAAAEAGRQGRLLAVFLLDLASFSRINDTLGHEVGDRVLIETVRRLKGVLSDGGLLARIGGDEFAVAIRNIEDEAEATRLGRILTAAISDPFLVEGHEAIIGSHVGVAIYPTDGTSADELARNADMAMYQAMKRGQDEVCLFSSSMDKAARERLLIERDLRKAVSEHELFLLYQPQIDTFSKRVVGFEALIRWNHPQLGVVPPDRFIPAAEETGLILPIGEWVLREACRFARRLRERGENEVVIAVNLSAVQFASKDLVEMVERILAESGIDSSAIELELTESTVMRDADAAAAMLTRLNRIGIGLAIDDFGTGHSSLNYLNLFPVGKIKIDKSFVQDIDIDASAADLARAIIRLGHSLQFKIVSEGVETETQYSHLKDEGCGIIQGFLFSRPVDPEEALRMISEQPFTRHG